MTDAEPLPRGGLGQRWQPPLPRRWLVAHLATLALILVVLVVAGRGNWFFFDEWDFLAARSEWMLLAPHNGHLSLFPQLLTTLVKHVFGLDSYWPYLALTFAAHLAAVHMVWRFMMRTAVAPSLATASALLFGVLAPGAENTLWAFQVGFITPVVTGLAALLVASRPVLRRNDMVSICVLLLVGVGFASTGLPIAATVLLFLLVRHGWRIAAVMTAVFGVVYGSWYLVFAHGSTGSDGFGAHTPGDVVVRVPEYISHALVDSLGSVLPVDALAPALIVALVVGIVVDLRRTRWVEIGASYYLLVGALIFATLTALTRVGLGVESASAGRYVYIYGAFLTPLIARLLTKLVGNSRTAMSFVCALILALAAYNAGGLILEGRNQAGLERTVDRAISAALAIDDGTAVTGTRAPAAVVAPTLTMDDVREFVAQGQYTPGEFGPEDLLGARVNLFLTPVPLDQNAPEAASCRPAVDGWVPIDIDADIVSVATPGMVGVIAEDGDVVSSFTQIPFTESGVHELRGIDGSIDLRLDADAAGGVCVVAQD